MKQGLSQNTYIISLTLKEPNKSRINMIKGSLENIILIWNQEN